MLALVLDEHFGLRFKFWGNFGLRASRSSTASVFTFGLWRVLRASLRDSVGTISISWVGQRRHRWRAPAMAAGGRWTGRRRATSSSLLARAALLSMDPVIPWYIYCSYDNAEFADNRCSCQALHWSAEAACQAEAGFWVNRSHSYPFLRHYYITITCYDSNNGSVISYFYNIMTLLSCIITCYHCNNWSSLPVTTLIMELLLQ